MQRFFFDVFSDGVAELDDLGTVLPNGTAMEAEARRLLPDLMSDDPQARDLVCVVRDGRGRSLYKVRLTITCEALNASSQASVRPSDPGCVVSNLGRSRQPSRTLDDGREPQVCSEIAYR